MYSVIYHGITLSISHNFARNRIDSYSSLPIEKILTFHNVIISITLVVNKNENNYYYHIFVLVKVRMKINPKHNYFKSVFVYYKCYVLIELAFLKELMLIKQVHQKTVYLPLLGFLK